MARAKTKAAGTNLPVPQSDAEAEQMIAQLGALQRDQAAAQARHDAVVAHAEEAHGKATKEAQQKQAAMIEGLSIWASANRDRLTKNGATKTVQLPTGTLLWRDGRFSVKHRGLKVDEVVAAVHARIAELETELAVARSERRRADAETILAKVQALEGCIRAKEELNKEAMLAAREVASTVSGVVIARGPEEFAVEPLASQISEVA